MPVKNGKTVPYQTHEQLKFAGLWLKEHFNIGYYLVFQIMANTGLRISDVLSLRYDENIDFETQEIIINESKGTKQAIALARNKVLKKASQVALLHVEDKILSAQLQAAAINEIWGLLPIEIQSVFSDKLTEAAQKAKPKKRRCPIPDALFEMLLTRKREFITVDGGYLFAGATFDSNRCKSSTRPISRETVWRIFTQISDALDFPFNTACHQLRKSFAVFLYHATGKDSALVVETVGWSDNKILQRYLTIDENQTSNATKLLQNRLSSS